MVFQNYGFETTAYNPINMSHASLSTPMPISKKRKAFEDTFETASDEFHRPKLNLPRSAGLVFNGEAQFHPLPADVNQAMLSQLGHNPFSNPGSGITPSSSGSGFGHEHKSSSGSDYFGANQYPDVEPYPSTSPPSGILGPAPGRHNSMADDSMDVDGSNPSRIHGEQCKSIPQLCVRYNGGQGSELWATCPDCGACSKVESSQPSRLCYSP